MYHISGRKEHSLPPFAKYRKRGAAYFTKSETKKEADAHPEGWITHPKRRASACFAILLASTTLK